MKTRLFWCVFLFLSGCDILKFEDNRYLPVHVDTAALVGYSFVSNNSTSATYDIRLAVLPWFNDKTDLDFYLQEEFNFEGEGTFEILNFSNESITATGSSATILLIDQSGSLVEIDPHNNRSKAMNKFLEDFTSPHTFLVGGFSEGGRLSRSPAEYFSENFKSAWLDQTFLFGLASRTGGNSSLYDAIDEALNKLIASTSTRKNLVIFQHAPDGGSAASISGLTAKAVSNNIKINFIQFGPSIQPTAISELVNQTNGLLASCPNDAHLITIFDHLQRLLNKSASVYKIRIKFNPVGGNVISGNPYVNTIKLKDAFNDYEFNPVVVTFKVP